MQDSERALESKTARYIFKVATVLSKLLWHITYIGIIVYCFELALSNYQ